MTLSTARQSSLLQQSWKKAIRPRHAAFSTSQPAMQKEGEVDEELSAKLGYELRIEKETRDSDTLPANLQEYLDRSHFELEDIPGQEEVALTRKFGDESIRVTFSIADLNNYDQEEDDDQFDSDPALTDEEAAEAAETNVQSGGANTKGAINQGRTKGGNFAVAPEDSIAPSDRPEGSYDESASGEEGDQEPSFPAHVFVNVEKPGKGTLQLEMIAQDGDLTMENICYFQKPELADAKTAELDWSRRNLYTGPPVGNLDEDLQVLLERYVDERGINTALALWIPEYIDWKEQKEYLNWLSNVKSFVDA
ncbi:MAG: hypothetical protein LQ338_004843 [Usnochroma carphineum]|nr:MAG: hypothetical protein LQ338_004843 [Usnochroma carphineum]